MDDGTYSENFPLKRGRAQGDNISPNTFNFGEQIAIWKIELDPQVAGIWRNFQIPNNIVTNNSSFFMYESRRQTSKNESLADDNTTLTLMEEENLARLREILDAFGDVSGLRCNFGKTMILPVGHDHPPPYQPLRS